MYICIYVYIYVYIYIYTYIYMYVWSDNVSGCAQRKVRSAGGTEEEKMAAEVAVREAAVLLLDTTLDRVVK